ncbi:hypothetical protein OPQ81_010378 [Rhizoctonia solani]|nr:hypothetical protein OPQ81_010378 [Rhizoctonia solani]
MFFRYDLSVPSQQDEELLNADDGPGLRWLIGLPDKLLLVLARMNTLLENPGSHADRRVVRELEEDLGAFKPCISCVPGDDPVLVVGRLAVQESWRLAGYVYLYMGVCGGDSSDDRVVKVQKQFMQFLETLKPRRNPDSFLIFPMLALGIATSSFTDRSILSARLWGVSECTKPGTTANDVVRILNDIWARTAKRPAVWSDLRLACLRVVGM